MFDCKELFYLLRINSRHLYRQIKKALHLRVVTDPLTLEEWALTIKWKSDRVASRSKCLAICRGRVSTSGCTHFSHVGTRCMLGHVDLQNGNTVTAQELADIYVHTRESPKF